MNKAWCLILVGVLLAMAAPRDGAGAGYVIGEEDVLQISVWGSPDLSAKVPVRPDGMISLSLVGDVVAAGRTPQELKKVLEEEFTKFIKTPTVSVVVTDINSFKVYVFGEGISRGTAAGQASGHSSGAVTLRRNTSLMQLIAQLGSLREADLSNAYLMRANQKLSVDFQKLVLKGDVSQDVALKPNDIIFIPDNFEKRIRVVGAVRTPGIYPYYPGMTALDSVLTAGGFTDFASQNNVIIVRKEGAEVKQIEVRLKDVIKDGDLSKNVPLQPGDMVSVRTSVF
jgi:polysaccharide export outer membrane protein